MPRTVWVPLPEEADLFCNIHIDESSQNLTYLVLGGIIVPHSHAERFEQDITAARDPIIAPFYADGTPRELKWEKVDRQNVDAYKKVIEAFWKFEVTHKLPAGKHVHFMSIAVNTSKKKYQEVRRWRVRYRLQQRNLLLGSPHVWRPLRQRTLSHLSRPSHHKAQPA